LNKRFLDKYLQFLEGAISTISVPSITDARVLGASPFISLCHSVIRTIYLKAKMANYLDVALLNSRSSKPIDTIEIRLPPTWNFSAHGLNMFSPSLLTRSKNQAAFGTLEIFDLEPSTGLSSIHTN